MTRAGEPTGSRRVFFAWMAESFRTRVRRRVAIRKEPFMVRTLRLLILASTLPLASTASAEPPHRHELREDRKDDRRQRQAERRDEKHERREERREEKRER